MFKALSHAVGLLSRVGKLEGEYARVSKGRKACSFARTRFGAFGNRQDVVISNESFWRALK